MSKSFWWRDRPPGIRAMSSPWSCLTSRGSHDYSTKLELLVPTQMSTSSLDKMLRHITLKLPATSKMLSPRTSSKSEAKMKTASQLTRITSLTIKKSMCSPKMKPRSRRNRTEVYSFTLMTKIASRSLWARTNAKSFLIQNLMSSRRTASVIKASQALRKPMLQRKPTQARKNLTAPKSKAAGVKSSTTSLVSKSKLIETWGNSKAIVDRI